MNDNLVFEIRNLDFYYGSSIALRNISIQIQPQKVTALIGPQVVGSLRS